MDKEQLEDLMITSEDMMYHVAKTLLYNDADCEDAIQEAIVKAFSKRHTLRSDDYAKTWLIRILINECYAIMRAEKKLVSLENVKVEKSIETKDYSDLYQAIYQLPKKMKLAITLYYMEGYSVKEIAKIQRTTESAIKNQLLRARKCLKKELHCWEVHSI
ncbi:MAG: sigma-70 family RNA polymerase sigma factor [Lachnospiraceae bacterium]|jgi:RNA polymerase sigma-70 factor (ECF subfamily)|nr:sigma-70 family RNA polymerase sigma factor [Lachnospiraceae bacterium]